MRPLTRPLIFILVLAVALGLSVGAAAAKTHKTTKPHAGQVCKPQKKAPTGFKCAKNKHGKYVLVKV